MPPSIEYGKIGQPFSGLGLERFGFSDPPPEACLWWESIQSPEFTLKQLQAAPDSALAILRSAAQVNLLEEQSLAIGDGNKYQNTEVEWLMNKAFPLKVAAVGSSYAESRDAGTTTDYIIPLATDKGALEIVLNPAWGLAWRLSPFQQSKNNLSFAAAVAQYPQLAKTLPEDNSVPLVDPRYRKPRYLSPRLLSEVTRQRINFETATADIHQLLTDLLVHSETEFSYGGILSGNNLLLPDNGFSYFSIENSQQGAGIKFWLGKEHGTKFVDIFGTKTTRSDNFSPLATQAIKINRALKPLHYLP